MFNRKRNSHASTPRRKTISSSYRFGKLAYHAAVRVQMRLARAKKFKSPDKEAHEGLYYLRCGQSSSEKILYIHGFADSKEGGLIPALLMGKKQELIVPDLPGFGESSKKQNNKYDLDYYTETLRHFIDHLQEGPLHLVGNSLGGVIALNLSLLYPDKFKSLALIDSAGFYYPEIDSVFHRYLRGQNIFQVKSKDEFDQLLKLIFHKVPRIPKPIYDYFFNELKTNHDWYGKLMDDLIPVNGQEEDRDQLIEDFSFNQRVSQLNLPVQLIWGEQDSVFPVEIARRVGPLIKTAKLDTISSCGHIPQVESPRQFIRIYKDFLKSINL